MTNFYHRMKGSNHVPSILGLTASPLVKSNPASLNQIESVLDAVCRTPTLHRIELQAQVQLPIFESVFYNDNQAIHNIAHPATITRLSGVITRLNINDDPYVKALRSDDSDRGKRRLAKVLLNHKTWTREQVNRVHRTSLVMHDELGPFAANYYISLVVKNCESLTRSSGVDGFLGMQEISPSEKRHLVDIMHQATAPVQGQGNLDNTIEISHKLGKLIETLLDQHDTTRGIIFVNQRATAEVLAAILRAHPATGNAFKFGTFVGNSMTAHRSREVAHVVDFVAQKDVLHQFRKGQINIVIATDVLEEGIDVPACNLVVCFDCPKNLKSFVQRRGRARQRQSKLIMLFDARADGKKLMEFQELEENMKRL